MGRIMDNAADQGILANSAPEPTIAPQSFVGTVTSADFDQKVLKASGKVLVDFSAIWCGPCHALAPILEEVAQEHKDEVKIYSCNIDDCRDLAGKYSVYAVPTLILFENGKETNSTTGAIPKNYVERFLGL